MKSNELDDITIQIKSLVKEYKMFNGRKDRLIETIFPKVKRHTSFVAVNNLDLTVKKGEVLGILGKNGAGKSTLLKMITGVVTPTSGEIDIKGKISSLLELGAAFNAELTGEENIYQHGEVMGLSLEEIESKKQDIIDFADIGEHLYQPVKTYSSGMFARLAFACAINVNPDILIVDEVLSVGDIAFQLKCFKKFEEFKKQGKTLLFVTHNVADVMKNCNRVIIISSGTKVFDGDVKAGVDKYKKMIVGIEDEENKKESLNKNIIKDEKIWKNNYVSNPDMVSYGNGKAEVIDYGIFDENNSLISDIENDKEVVLKSKIKFNEEIEEPIFTLTLKDFRGMDIVGTNTMQQKIVTGRYESGDVVTVEFKQKLSVAPGKYTLSFSCTHINENGDFEVLSRKYDALLVEVISNRDCVGLFRLDSNINIINNKGN